MVLVMLDNAPHATSPIVFLIGVYGELNTSSRAVDYLADVAVMLAYVH